MKDMRKILGLGSALGLAACLGAGADPAPRPPALPATPADAAPPSVAAPGVSDAAAARARLYKHVPTVTEYHGRAVSDDFAWLEDASHDDVKAFVAAENERARAHLDALGVRKEVEARVRALLGKSSRDWLTLVHAAGKVFALEAAPPKQQPVVVVLDLATLDPARERVVVDPAALDPSGRTTVDWFVPSPDGRVLAVSLSKNGTESGDVHLLDVVSGKPRAGEVLARVNGGTAGGSLAWTKDGRAFYYTRYPRAGERPDEDLDFYQQVYRHELGKPTDKDTYVFGKGLPKIAEIELEASDDGKHLLARVANGDGGEVEHHVLTVGSSPDKDRWTRLSRFSDGLAHASFGADGRVYAVSHKGAPRGQVVAFAPPFTGPSATVLAEGDGVIHHALVTRDALYAFELVGGPSRARRVPLAGRVTATAELPILPVSSVRQAVRVGRDLLVRNESYTEPPAWYLYHASKHTLERTKLAKASPADFRDVEVSRESCVSKDGTRVPMSVLRRRGAKLDGKAPALLTGYGGYALSREPRQRALWKMWLDAGGVVADANLRGGAEMGEAWHRAGNLTNKQNVFDDFYACAKELVRAGYTTPERLAITGRSNGGLLMGAALVQHPEAYRAVVAQVGIYDMLKVEQHSNGAFNVTEYGTVKDRAQFEALLAYSPLHNVRDGAAYPAVLFTAGANDPRVDAYHSRKMTARLREATSSDRPVLLVTTDAGHGMGTPLDAEIAQETDVYAFLFSELGVSFAR